MFKIDKLSDIENVILNKLLCSEHALQFELCDNNFSEGFRYLSKKFEDWAQNQESFNIVKEFTSPIDSLTGPKVISNVSITSFENTTLCKVYLSPANLFRFCGTVDSYNDLPASANVGYYFIDKTGKNLYFWDGNSWQIINN